MSKLPAEDWSQCRWLSGAWSRDGRIALDCGETVIYDILKDEFTRLYAGSGEAREQDGAGARLGRDYYWMSDGALVSKSDGDVQVLPAELTRDACQWVLRNMSVDEWLTYVGPLFIYRTTCGTQTATPPMPSLGDDRINYFLLTQSGRTILIGVAITLVVLILLVTTVGVPRLNRWLRTSSTA